MTSVQERTKLMEEGNIRKVLMTFAIPAIITALISAIYNMADTMFVGMLDNTSATAAVSVVFPLFLLINALGQMIGVGAASYIARLLGEKKNEEANKVATVSFGISVIISIIITIFCMLFLDTILKFLGATESIMPFAVSYGGPLVLGSIFAILQPTLANIIRSEGNTKFSAIVVGSGAIINIILDPIFIINLDMGVKGASLATVLSQMIACMIMMMYFLKDKGLVKIKGRFFKPTVTIIKEVIVIGSASFITQGLMSLSMTLLNVQSKAYGDEAIAAMGITVRVTALVVLVVMGYNQGFQPVAGYNYGAKNYKRLKAAIKESIKITTIFSTLATILLWVFAKDAIGIFSNDPVVIEIGQKALKATLIMYPLLGFQQLYCVLFQTLGKGKEALICSSCRQGLFFIPTIYILPKFFGLNGILYTQMVADFCTVILIAMFAIKNSKVLDEEEEEFIQSQAV